MEKALSRIRPTLQADGGDVELVEVTNKGVLKAKLIGACCGCPMSIVRLEMSTAP